MKDMLLQVEPLIPALRRYARALVRNRANADDLVQDCLERAVSRWYQRLTATFAPGSSPSCTTWQSVSFANRRRAAGMSRSTRPMRTISARQPRRNEK